MIKKDIYQEVTNQIISDLEKGLPVWEKPWKTGFPGFPKNVFTKSFYSGVNNLILWSRQFDMGLDCAQWITFRQAQILGGHVKKGERASRIIFYKTIPWEEEEKEEKKGKKKELKKEGGKEKKIEIPIIKSHPLFNLSQCEGLDHLIKKPDKKGQAFQGEARTENLIKATQAKIKMANYDKARYIPSEDQILMPRKSQFKTQEGFYSTMFHELSHWTGHKSRLNRDMISKFGTKKYAFEELVAEISASFICCHLGFEYSTQHSTYIKDWLEVLKEDKKTIFRASSQAQKATEFILGGVQGEAS